MTRPPNPRIALLTYLKVQESYERDMLAILRRAAAGMRSELAALDGIDTVSARVRRLQLEATLNALQGRIRALWELVGSTTMAYRTRAARGAGEVLAEYAAFLASAGLSTTEIEIMKRGLVAQAERMLDLLESREKLSRIDLSKRVYRSHALISGQLDRLIMTHLSRPTSAREIARAVRTFVNPNTAGGVRYAAMRLGRTELNNVFHATQIRQAQDVPWLTGMKWNLSGSHPRPDACNDYADEDHDGLGPGIFKAKNVPGKPHPQCLCNLTPETVSQEEFLAALTAGKYDSWAAKIAL